MLIKPTIIVASERERVRMILQTIKGTKKKKDMNQTFLKAGTDKAPSWISKTNDQKNHPHSHWCPPLGRMTECVNTIISKLKELTHEKPSPEIT